MAYRDFSIAQKIALAAIVMGSIMCLLGAAVPYWVLFNGTDVGVPSDVIGVDVGLWMWCPTVLGVSGCQAIPWDFINDATFHVVRAAACACVFLGGLSGLIALCMACCCQGSNTICVGVTCFLAGACGATVLGIFISKVDVIVSLNIADKHVAHYGWGMIVFAVGFSILLLASFVACFASPNNPLPAYVVSSNPTVVVSQTASSTTPIGITNPAQNSSFVVPSPMLTGAYNAPLTYSNAGMTNPVVMVPPQSSALDYTATTPHTYNPDSIPFNKETSFLQ